MVLSIPVHYQLLPEPVQKEHFRALSHLPLAWQGLSFSPQVQAGELCAICTSQRPRPRLHRLCYIVIVADPFESLKAEVFVRSAISVSEAGTSHPGVRCALPSTAGSQASQF